MNSALDELYREIIMDHFRSPRGRKPVESADIASEGHNPSCGDDITLQAAVKDGVLKDIHVDCHGCAISVASGSMLAELVKGKSFAEIERIADLVRGLLRGEIDELPAGYEDIEALKGVRKFPVRVKCALLSWVTLIDGLKKHAAGDGHSPMSATTEEDA